MSNTPFLAEMVTGILRLMQDFAATNPEKRVQMDILGCIVRVGAEVSIKIKLN